MAAYISRSGAVVVVRVDIARHRKDMSDLFGVAIVGRSHQIGLPDVCVVWVLWHGLPVGLTVSGLHL